MGKLDSQLAEAIGRRILGNGGAELLEMIYLLQEDNALETLREIAVMSEDNKLELLNFIRRANANDKVKLLVHDAGIVMSVRN